MGFMLASLAGGLASGFAAKEKEEEKLGEVFGEYAFKTLYKNYETTKKEREEKEIKWKFAAVVMDRFLLIVSAFIYFILFIASVMNIPNLYKPTN